MRDVSRSLVRVGLLWGVAGLVHCIAFASDLDTTRIVVDVVLIAIGVFYAADREVWPRALGAALVLVGFLVVQWLVKDRNGIWLDESDYLATLRAGHPLRDMAVPFSVRWLEPVLAGPLDLLPARDADALKALNFGALVVTGVALVELAVRLGASRRPRAAAVPDVLVPRRLLGDEPDRDRSVQLRHVRVHPRRAPRSR